MAGISITDLEDMWSTDCKIDTTEPSRELAKIPVLHAKYSRYLNHHSLMVRKLMADLRKLERIKADYYSGDLNNPEDLTTYGLEPFAKKILRSDVFKYVNSDSDIIDLNLKIDLNTQVAKFAESIISELKSRTYQLQNIVKWETFIGGS